MVLLLDSLGQCVSALSERFAAADSIRDSTVNCLPHCHREKHSEVRHRKDIHHQQEEAQKPMVACQDLQQCYSEFKQFACCSEISSCLGSISEKCPYLMQVTNGKVPTSILKRPCPSYASDTEHNHRRKGERRVRFREPETTVHGEYTVQTALRMFGSESDEKWHWTCMWQQCQPWT